MLNVWSKKIYKYTKDYYKYDIMSRNILESAELIIDRDFPFSKEKYSYSNVHHFYWKSL